jgi:hypothetical protein
MILEKKQNMPKQKTNINKDNLIILKNDKNIDIDIDIDIESDSDDESITIIKKNKKNISNTINV